jgi:hypothetical protein
MTINWVNSGEVLPAQFEFLGHWFPIFGNGILKVIGSFHLAGPRGLNRTPNN